MKISEVTKKKSAALDSIFKVINSLKDDEVIPTKELHERSHTSHCTTASHPEELAPYRLRFQNTQWYGNKTAIAALRRQIGHP